MLDLPPLLPPGLHTMSRQELKRLCVDNFPDSDTRGQIALGLFFILDRLAQSGVTGEAWVDGSFVTEKLDPNDGDVVFVIPAAQYEQGSPRQQEAIEWIADDLRGVLQCHTFVMLQREKNTAEFADYEESRDYWLQTFGADKDNNPKGIAVLRVGP